MNKVFRTAATAVAAMMLLGMLAVPASAATNATALISGAAEVGKWFSEHCGKDGVATVTGRGLYLPNLKAVPGVNNGDREEHAVFHFKSVAAAAVVLSDQAGNAAHATTTDIEVCGYISPAVDGAFSATKPPREDGLGAACGASKGHDGRGRVKDNLLPGGQTVQLQDIGWPAALGGALPITGKYVETDEMNGFAKKPKEGMMIDLESKEKGSVLGVVQAIGGLPCSGLKNVPPQVGNNGNGAQSFIVVGSVELVNENVSSLIANHGAKCKNDGPADTINPDGKKANNKPNPPTSDCPAKNAD